MMRSGGMPLGSIAEDERVQSARLSSERATNDALAGRKTARSNNSEDGDDAKPEEDVARESETEDSLVDASLRRPSLEYTVGGDDGKHRVGRRGKESNLETCEMASVRKSKDIQFSVSRNVDEAEDVIFAQRPRHRTIVHSTVETERARHEHVYSTKAARSAASSPPKLTKSQRDLSATSRSLLKPSLPRQGETQKSIRTTMTSATAKSSSTRPAAAARPRTATSRRLARPAPVKTGKPKREVSRSSDFIEAEKAAHRVSEPGERISARERMVLKQQNGVVKLRARVRTNVQERIRELDAASDQRWDVTSQLDYESRLRQGVGVVSKSYQVGWIWDTVEDERTSRRREAQSDAVIAARKERRARCSTACANLYPA